jgi:hypothetical protein
VTVLADPQDVFVLDRDQHVEGVFASLPDVFAALGRQALTTWYTDDGRSWTTNHHASGGIEYLTITAFELRSTA